MYFIIGRYKIQGLLPFVGLDHGRHLSLHFGAGNHAPLSPLILSPGLHARHLALLHTVVLGTHVISDLALVELAQQPLFILLQLI